MNKDIDQELLTIGQAAEYLGVSLNTLRRWDESGKLVAIRKDGGGLHCDGSGADRLHGNGDAAYRLWATRA